MGASQSTGSHPQPPTRALHVLRVTSSSPASQTNIEPFFDFVVGLEGDTHSSRKMLDAAELEAIVEKNEGKNLNLLVWNSKSQTTRVVKITPSRTWSQQSLTANVPSDAGSGTQPSLLGLSMRICEPEFAHENVWHVLDVLEGSPAESAGLVPYGDWIIGWSGGVLGAEGDFYDVVEAHIDKPLRVYVYSYDFDTIREVVLVPNRQWGGEGLLGCVFGFGLLHRIPPIPNDRQPGSLPPELRDSAEFEEQTLYVPADAAPDQLNLEFHSDSQNQHQHFFSPPPSHDFSYSYSNRGAALARQPHSPTIMEEVEQTEGHPHSSRSSQDLHHTNDSNYYHHHQGHEHDHEHGHHNHRVGALPISHRSTTLGPSLNSDIQPNGDSRS
ncbi:GRASP55/65 PDZ-like domain-containing protein [Multifurca ochricompacta]|uniref:GRASP55/65 PDZ-like domain-containing protein n=1 Tax=Multifurca ochricompacta TaxID=376703 RepID=A0AAD4M955_9AGAM|nr:GRASP55/65 PDZ-like domain-containing protein [Multifurca ochricompacta]